MTGRDETQTPQQTPPPAGSQPQETTPDRPRRRKGLVRWSVLLVLIVLPLALLYVFKDAVARQLVERGGSALLDARVQLEGARLDPFAGRLTLERIRATDPARGDDELFAADEAVADLDLAMLLRGRVVIDRLELARPRGKLTRQRDGSITLGQQPPPTPPPVIEPETPGGSPESRPEDMTLEQWRRKLEEIARKRDMVDSVKQWLHKVQRWLAEREREREQQRERREAGRMDPSGRARYVRARTPALWIREMVCRDAEIEIVDRGADGAEPLHLVDTKLRLANVSTDPWTTGPIEIELEGRFAEQPEAVVHAAGELALAPGGQRCTIEIEARRLPLDRLDPLVHDSLPIRFGPGSTVDLKLPLRFENFEIDWRPWLLLDRLNVSLRDPSTTTIAGLDARRLVEALREVKTIELADLHVFGSVYAPQVETGDTLQRLLTEGAKRFAAKQAARLEAIARERAGEAAHKLGATETGRRVQQAAGALLGVGGAKSGNGEDATSKPKGAEPAGGIEEKGKRVLRGLLGGE
ncbi:MAG: DUF748 domain-containing protein [Planctomycetota bacterium]|nr:MAG: DUF748 domain-containing protein [Planctomycetota bacterium]